MTRNIAGEIMWSMVLEMTVDPGWAYCPRCNTLSDWSSDSPNCPATGLCHGRSVLPIPTTRDRHLRAPYYLYDRNEDD